MKRIDLTQPQPEEPGRYDLTRDSLHEYFLNPDVEILWELYREAVFEYERLPTLTNKKIRDLAALKFKEAYQ